MIRFTVNKRGRTYRLDVEDTDTHGIVNLVETTSGADGIFAAAGIMERAFRKAEVVAIGSGAEKKERNTRKLREPKQVEPDAEPERKPKAKRLTKEQKAEIDRLAHEVGWTCEVIAGKLGVEVSQVKRCLAKLEKLPTHETAKEG